jgi:outer membrane biosynthesis protein TonB
MLAVSVSAVVLAACGKNATSNRALSDDLKRDLQLASSTDLGLASQQAGKQYALTELGQTSAPAPSTAPKRGAGPKAVKSKTPTVKAAPEPTVTSETSESQVEVASQAPAATTAPVPEPSAPAVPRPSPVTPSNGGVGAQGQAGGGAGTGSSEGGGSILGTIFGAVIRGGVVDGDHCDPRTDGRHRGRPPYGGYPPNLPNSGSYPGPIFRGRP